LACSSGGAAHNPQPRFNQGGKVSKPINAAFVRSDLDNGIFIWRGGSLSRNPKARNQTLPVLKFHEKWLTRIFH
jgi:hypothetical protein